MAWNKRNWTDKEIGFIKESFDKMPNKEIAQALNVKISTLRTKLYQMGLKRMELEYWTVEQVNDLKRLYKIMGDLEMAELFNKKYPKNKLWTKKHIEKKRRYLKIKRTGEQLNIIHQRNKKNGSFIRGSKKTWSTRGVAKEGDIRFCKMGDNMYARIKINGKFIFWHRWIWENTYGRIPKGMNVAFKDGNHYNLTIDNLILLSDKEIMRRNTIHRYPDYIKRAIYDKNINMKKTISDLRETLFETIEMIKDSKITAERAKVVGELAQTIINSAKAENEYLKINKQGKATGFIEEGQKIRDNHLLEQPKAPEKEKVEPYQFHRAI